MARANSPYQARDYYDDDPRDEDWQDLRGELVALLGEVEAQVSRARPRQAAAGGIAERMRALREQVADASPDARHREALRSVKRAVDRFGDRDEAADSYAHLETQHPRRAREALETAVREIRASQRRALPPAATEYARRDHDELAQAIEGLAGRLERLDIELRTSARSQSGNVKEIAEQVAQLSHVVELLAGAVGETGQVKRLEAQIAGLAKLVSQTPQVDLSALTQRLDGLAAAVGSLFDQQGGRQMTQRLDDVAATVGRLADLQVQFANRVDSSAEASRALRDDIQTANAGLGEGIRAIDAGVREGAEAVGAQVADGMRAIEESVRNLYDRIDAIEKSTAVPPAELEKLTAGLARFTEAMQNPPEPHSLVALAEDLNARIAALESGHRDVGGLKADAEALRAAVSDALEPRFTALEMQIEALSERLGEQRPDISVDQLEAQVRQLVARMDQTGEQLTGLARLHSEPSRQQAAPDYEALAEIVAARTSEALAQHPSPGGGLDDAGIDEIERRLTRLMSLGERERPTDDLSGIDSSIREVNERLARLELSLAKRAAESDLPATGFTEPPAREPEPEPAPAAAAAAEPDPIGGLIAEEGSARAPEQGDTMQASPAEDAPLKITPFGDPDPVRGALEAKNGPRKQHPGLADAVPPGGGEAPAADKQRPPFDPSTIERPPAPKPSFDMGDAASFDAPRSTVTAPEARDDVAPEVQEDFATEPPPSTNTFIAAARRAAQRSPQGKSLPGSGGSLVAKAFDRLQPAADKEQSAERPEKLWSRLFRGKKTQAATAPDAAQTGPASAEEPAAEAPPRMRRSVEPRQPGFISRHRRPILLAIAVTVIALLTVNLVMQRQGADAPVEPEPAAEDTAQVEAGPPELGSAPMASITPEITSPRVIPMVDTLATSSINAASGFSPSPTSGPALSPASAAAESVAVAVRDADPAADLIGPVVFDPPPEAIGPEALRMAAARGDARAQFEIAAIYTEGRAVSEDLDAAAVWYERSAAQGFAPAQYRLGNLYENGRGVPRDLEQARLWYQRAAEAGNRMAMHNLAAIHASGEIGKQNFETAAEWFEKAAERGMRDSQFNLGMLYARGLGVPQSLEDSYKWFAIAAHKGDADAAKARDDMLRTLDADTVKRFNEIVAGFRPAEIDLVANYAPIGTWSESFDPGETIETREIVQVVQAALNALGFDVGPPDGLSGPRTSEAIRAFERSTGMSETGAVNPRLLAVLGSQPV